VGESRDWRSLEAKKAGFNEFQLFDLSPSVEAMRLRKPDHSFPGAHYLPIPTSESAVCGTLEELGVIEGYTSLTPIYREHLADPRERLYLHGRCKKGCPRWSAPRKGPDEYNRFKDLMLSYRHRRQRWPKPFAIPMDFSSRDPEFLDLII
jgi:hypothetical protein